MMIASGIELTTGQFGILWQRLGFGRIPYPLEATGGGATMRAERALDEPGSGHRAPYSEVATLLGVLARGAITVDCAGYLGGPLRALVARDHDTGVLAVLDRHTVRLTEIWPDTAASSIVDLLPAARPGPGSVLSVPVSSLTELPRGGADPPDDWLSGGSMDFRQSEEERLAELMAERTAGGQFGINLRTWSSPQRRAETLVSWFDARGGRYLLVREGGWVSLTPADNQRIAHRITAVIDGAEG